MLKIKKCFNWLPNHYNLNRKRSSLLYEMLKLKICLLLSLQLRMIPTTQANGTTLTPTMQTLGNDDLLVCIPKNNTNSCIKYVNSPINGLIELNESKYPALKGFRGNYDYNMIARVNPFWLNFEPTTDFSYYVMGTFYTILFIFGVTGNGLVIYMFARCKSLRTASNILVFNLAICDFMIVAKCPVAIYNNFMRGPALGDWGCRIYGFIGGFSGCASIGMLTVISIDRYIVVVNPLGPLYLGNKFKYYYCFLFLAWFEAFFFSLIPLLEVGLSAYVPEGYLTTCSFDYLDKTLRARIFMFLFFVFGWCVPLTIICFCYFHILKEVLISKKLQSNHNKQRIEVRLSFIVLLVIALWFLAWTPYALVAMAGVFGMEEYLTPTRSMIPALFCKTAACLNPFLYTISHKRFRSELIRLFFKRQPIYQFSASRSSNLTSSSRRGRHCLVMGTNGLRNNERLCMSTVPVSDPIKTNFYSLEDSTNGIFHQRKLHKKPSFARKQISPAVSKDDQEIFVIELKNVDSLRTQPLETNF